MGYSNRAADNARRKLEYRQLRLAVLGALGGKCAHCGFSDFRTLQIDHISGGGSKVAKLNTYGSPTGYLREVLRSIAAVENKYQCLCANCNWIKRAESGEDCGWSRSE